eukprot:COSAG03_NODE_19929_length_327_cov_1.135965_1_plen_20_part_01
MGKMASFSAAAAAAAPVRGA